MAPQGGHWAQTSATADLCFSFLLLSCRFSSRDPEPSLFPCNEGRWQRRALGCRTSGTVKSLGVALVGVGGGGCRRGPVAEQELAAGLGKKLQRAELPLPCPPPVCSAQQMFLLP